MDHPVSVECFTLPQAAEALGKSFSTLRRWLEIDKIPSPYLKDIGNNAMVYSVGELEVIVRIISQNEREFMYSSSPEHNYIIQALHQAIHGYRANFI